MLDQLQKYKESELFHFSLVSTNLRWEAIIYYRAPGMNYPLLKRFEAEELQEVVVWAVGFCNYWERKVALDIKEREAGL
jgi:hypothetical protein